MTRREQAVHCRLQCVLTSVPTDVTNRMHYSEITMRFVPCRIKCFRILPLVQFPKHLLSGPSPRLANMTKQVAGFVSYRQRFQQHGLSLAITVLVLGFIISFTVCDRSTTIGSFIIGQQLYNSAMRVLGSSLPGRHRPTSAVTPRPSPAVAQPLVSAAPTCTSHADTCNMVGPGFGGHSPASPFAQHRGPAPTAATPEISGTTKTSTIDRRWWNQEKDLWTEVHTEEDFRREVRHTVLLWRAFQSVNHLYDSLLSC